MAIHNGIEREDFQGNLLEFTAISILKFMKINGRKLSE